MGQIIDWLIKYQWYFYIGLFLALVLTLVLLQIFVFSRKRYKRQVAELEEKYNQNKQEMENNNLVSLNRIKAISLNNQEYISYYQDKKDKYDQITNNEGKQSSMAVNSLKELIADKSYRGIKDTIESTQITLQDYAKACKNISKDLNNLLKPEEELRQEILSEKEKYRKIKDLLSEHQTELVLVEPSINAILAELEKSFIQYENSLDFANYEEANKILAEITTICNELLEKMNDLPYLTSLVTMVVPKKLADLEEAYQEMESENYPLHHLKINVTIEQIKNELIDIEDKLKFFELNGIKEEINNITETINYFLVQFDVEKEAKIQFEKVGDDASKDTYELEKDFAKILRSLPEYKSIYELDEKYLNQINFIKNDIDRMGTLKRDLDMYVHSTTKQPYSIMLKKSKDLRIETIKIRTTLKDFYNYLSSLKAKTDEIYLSLSKNYEILMQLEYKVRNLNVDALSELCVLKFKQAYEYLYNLNEILIVQPIDVVKLTELYNQCLNHFAETKKFVEEQIELATIAENSIVYANSYRPEYAKAREVLQKSENSFNEGDFARTADENVAIIKELHPDASR